MINEREGKKSSANFKYYSVGLDLCSRAMSMPEFLSLKPGLIDDEF